MQEIIKYIQGIIEYIATNHNIVVMMYVVTIIGIIMTYFSLQRKSISYSVERATGLKDTLKKYDKLYVFFRGNRIDSLSVAKMTIWNSGNITINRDDISEIEPLLISSLEENTILGFDILYQSKTANNFVVKLHDGKISVGFDYIDKNEGVILKVYFSGTEYNWITASGSLKGIKEIKINQGIFNYPKVIWFDFICLIVGLLGFFLMLLFQYLLPGHTIFLQLMLLFFELFLFAGAIFILMRWFNIYSLLTFVPYTLKKVGRNWGG